MNNTPRKESRVRAESSAPELSQSFSRTPLSWYGGKIRLAKELVRLMPPHRLYVEVFGGGAAVLFAKQPSFAEVYNDLDEEVVNFFRVLRGRLGARLIRQLNYTPHARTEHLLCKMASPDRLGEVERARRLFVLVRQSYGQLFANGYSTSAPRQAIARTWSKKVEDLHHSVNRLRGVQIENLSFEKLIMKYDSRDTLFYCDPPYMHEVRTAASQHKYVHEMTTADHEHLLTLLCGVQGKVMLSGYASPLYTKHLKGWHKWSKRMQMPCSANRKRRSVKRVETVWMNYDLPKR